MMQQIGNNDYRPQMPSDPKQYSLPMAGLTKREYFAGIALQGLMANPIYNNPDDPKTLPTVENFAITALIYADALLSKL